MERDFWLSAWETNKIAFHEGRPNHLLVAHAAELGLPAGGRVFVPLCGKSHDLRWLRAQGYTVVGVELSRLAVEQLFAELGETPEVTPAGPLERFAVEGLSVFAGDIFALDRATLGEVDAIYDRAALVALPEPLRRRYAAHLLALTGGAPQLLVTFEYDQALQSPPPFSLSETVVRALYDDAYALSRVEVRDVPGGLKGICPATESVWLLRPRP